jgi:hypothetical protein
VLAWFHPVVLTGAEHERYALLGIVDRHLPYRGIIMRQSYGFERWQLVDLADAGFPHLAERQLSACALCVEFNGIGFDQRELWLHEWNSRDEVD